MRRHGCCGILNEIASLGITFDDENGRRYDCECHGRKENADEPQSVTICHCHAPIATVNSKSGEAFQVVRELDRSAGSFALSGNRRSARSALRWCVRRRHSEP
jgi:hypothetical protein